MKKLLFVLVAGSLVATSCVNNPKGDKAETTDATTPAAAGNTSYAVDAASSTITWAGRKVSGAHDGTIKMQSGDLSFTDGKLVGGTFVMDMNSIANNDITDAEYKAKLEGHLKSDDFFAVSKFPTSKFEITNVVANSDSSYTVSGNLTIKDSTKNITFPVSVVEASATKFASKADFNINRNDWGVNYTGMKDDLISNEINFKVNLVANKN